MKRFLQSKLQFGASRSISAIKYTSSAELAAPALTSTLSCKAHANTDFCQRLVLLTELQWKAAKHKQPTTATVSRADNTKSVIPTDSHDNSHPSSSHQHHRAHAAWHSSSPSRLPWTQQTLQYPVPVYASKPRSAHWKESGARGKPGLDGDRDKDSKDDSQAGKSLLTIWFITHTFIVDIQDWQTGHMCTGHMGAGDQCTLQLKGSASPEGKPPPAGHIRLQKAMGQKLQLRAQASAALAAGATSLLPSRWQLEAKRKLQKGAMVNVRMQREEMRASQQQGRHRLQIEHKGQANWVTCTCTHQPAGMLCQYHHCLR